ncbi:uncharacterized protein [Apostichopus japonicus]|uniref:uncharacterized protein n=1 Tax=Stichopus japonicus TaxID=307972 RepID=UPI003AB11EB1
MDICLSNRQKRRRIVAEVNRHINSLTESVHIDVETDVPIEPDIYQQHNLEYDSCAAHPSPVSEQAHLPPVAHNLHGEQEHVQCNDSGSDVKHEVHVPASDQSSDHSDDHLAPPFDSSSASSDSNNETDLKEELVQWANNHNITHTAITDLLKVLKKYHPELPKQPRTLLDTSTTYTTVSLSGGQYYHFGVKAGVVAKLPEMANVAEYQELTIQVNIDGLPLFKSSNNQFWPILGMLTNCDLKKPFLIGLFYGLTKPADLHFLDEFVAEAKKLQSDGFMYNEQHLTIKISAIVCDTPARALIKNIKGHSGYYGCDKCIQRGLWLEKVTFPQTNANLRTNASFIAMTNKEHHLGTTPLSELNIGMITAFPADYMHLVRLGVMRRLLKFWTKGPLRTRLGPRVVKAISVKCLGLRTYIPSEFARKPRDLKDIDRWKATEFREFLLYTGPVALLGSLCDELYHNFMLLSIAMLLLLNPRYCLHYCQYAHELLVLFVQHYGQLYGQDMITYNVHGLVHLSDEVKRFGSLDNISCFPFENYLGQLKRKYSMTSYAIVIFTGQGEVALVPEVWCIGTDLCYWPPYKTMLRFEKAVHSCQPPSEQWSKHKIRILSTTDSYEKACRLVRKAEDTSDIQTDANDNPANPPCRKRKRRSRYISDSDESDDTVPNEFAEPSSPPPCPSPSLLSLPLLPIVPPALPPTSDTRSVSLPLPSHTPSGTTISSPDNDRVPSTVAGSTLPPAISYSVARRWPVNSTPSRTTISRPSNSSNINAVQSTSNLSPVGHMSTSGTNVSALHTVNCRWAEPKRSHQEDAA